mmetsp:Transcript_87367/g.251930  ORF Transcript_87367/g.251930 Transcript_87367/m.251930 type:complete len:228 (-) Transcript_87367:2168-2851(-)
MAAPCFSHCASLLCTCSNLACAISNACWCLVAESPTAFSKYVKRSLTVAWCASLPLTSLASLMLAALWASNSFECFSACSPRRPSSCDILSRTVSWCPSRASFSLLKCSRTVAWCASRAWRSSATLACIWLIFVCDAAISCACFSEASCNKRSRCSMRSDSEECCVSRPFVSLSILDWDSLCACNSRECRSALSPIKPSRYFKRCSTEAWYCSLARCSCFKWSPTVL